MDHRSLRTRLPALFSTLIIAVVAVVLWAAFREVEATLARAGGQRAQAAADQVASLLERSAQQGSDELRRLAAHPDVRHALEAPSDVTIGAARARLEPLVATGRRRVDVWDDHGSRVLELVRSPRADQGHAELLPAARRPDSPGHRPIQVLDNVVFSELVAEIPAAPEAPAARRLGYLVIRSTMSVNPPGALGRLVGRDAVVLAGNRSGAVWTDLSKPVSAPPVDLTRAGVAEYRASNGGTRLGAAALIRDTPWAVWVEFARSAVIAPARLFVWRMSLVGLFFVAVAAVVTRALTARITTPLSEVTIASEAIAGGDYSKRVPAARGDEIGRLAATFNRMAGQIEEAYHRLEARVHERTLAEQALRETEERTRFALGAARTGVWEIDLASDRVTWSDTMAAVFGLSAERVPGTRFAFLDLIHVDDRSSVSDAMAQAIRDRRDFAVDFRTVCPDGSLHWVDVRSRVVCESNVPVRLLGTAIDFTERKSLEDQLRQAQKMEAIGQLAGGVAHDFNNLLTAIRGYADLVSDGLGPEHALRPDVREIVKAADRASSLTRQLLAFSRKQVLEPVLVDINSLVAASSDLLRRVIGTHIELVTNLAPNLAPIFADATQLDQIVMNLAVNARDAMAGGGRLWIETASVQLDESSVLRDAEVRPGRYVMLAVTDTGSGMSEETRRHLFEPFFTTKEQGRGTGLGLATVYGIVKQSGGYIWVYTEPGHGTTIKVYFPEAEGVADTDRVERPLQTPAGGTEKVLLVEDEEAVRFLTRTMLERKGYSVIDVASPMQAEATFSKRHDWIDLLITDVIMPGASGPGLFQNLVKHAPGLKVLYMSGYTGDTVMQHGRIDAGIAFLQKPFTAEGLARKVREVLDQ